MRLPATGEVFEEKFELLDVIGEGGFARIYRARDLRVQRDVALKVLNPHDGEYNEARAARFMREGRIFAELQDPHNITMFDFGQSSSGLFWMAFEYIDGIDLRRRLAIDGPLPPPVVAHILAQVLRALREAHTSGILHRDLKPANVLTFEYAGDPNNVKLIDYGIAKPVRRDDTAITAEGRIVGTPRYMAPEQVFGEELTPATDLYALGLVAYELLTGEFAVQGRSRQEIREEQVRRSELVVPAAAAPAELRAVVDRMLRRDPNHRYPSANAALADLREAQRAMKRGPRAQGDHAPPRERRPTKRPDRWVIVGATATVVVIAGLVLLALLSPPEPPPPHDAPPPTRPRVGAATTMRDASAPEREPEPRAPADGCGRDNVLPGVKTRSDRSVGLHAREWLVHVPEGYDPAKRHPVVLMFHASVANAGSMLDETQFGAVADRHGYVLVAPESRTRTAWDDPDDQDFVRRALLDTAREFCVDLGRVFALGEAAGGRFVTELPCAMPLSAIATTGHGERVGAVVCEPDDPPPRLRLYGLKDPHVPATGGSGCLPFGTPFLGAREVNERWREVHECGDEPRIWFDDRGGRCTTWECDSPFVSCETDGGHDWPRARGRTFEVPGCESKRPRWAFPNGEAIARFFDELGRPVRR